MTNRFFLNYAKVGNNILVKGVEDGIRFRKKVHFKPTLFTPSKVKTEWTTIHGEFVEPKVFDDMSAAYNFIEQYKEVPDYKIMGMERWHTQWCHEYYPEELDYTKMNPSLINIGYYDIETRPAADGYSEPKDALGEISAICLLDNHGNHFTFGLNDFVPNERCETIYTKFDTEKQMLLAFIKVWKHLDFDIITGWNNSRYDDVYVYYRIKRILGEESAKQLSPWNMVREYSVDEMNTMVPMVEFKGIESIDYMDLFKKFGIKYGPQENYKLDTIAETVLGRKKVGYEEYGSLVKFEQENPQLFMEYNVTDTNLVKEINDKTQYLELMLLMAYQAKTNYSDVLGTVAWWDSYGYGHLKKKGMVVPLLKKAPKESFPGGYVKAPIVGRHEWTTTYDFTSLYSSVMMMWNTSPETLGEWIESSIDMVSDGNYPTPAEGYCVAANGWQFKTDKVGFIPELVSIMFHGRVALKKEMKRLEQEHEILKKSGGDEKVMVDILTEINRLDAKQNAAKLANNSVYGAVGNTYFRFYDIRIASAITACGQAAIKTSDRVVNQWLDELIGVKKDRVAYCDTDSAAIVYNDLLNKINPNASPESKVKMCISLSQDKIEPLLDKTFTNMGNALGCTKNYLFMKTEGICEASIYLKKKKYIQKVLWSEGVWYAKPKFKIMGLEAVRSSTPKVCQKMLKESYETIIDSTEQSMQEYIARKKKEFNSLPVEIIGAPRGINNMEKFIDRNTIYREKSGCPLQVRAALLYNHLVDKLGLKSELELIKAGDKIKYVFLKMPNTLHENVIGFPTKLPEKFNLHKYVDYSEQFDKMYLTPISKILAEIGWKAEYVETVDSLFGE